MAIAPNAFRRDKLRLLAMRRWYTGRPVAQAPSECGPRKLVDMSSGRVGWDATDEAIRKRGVRRGRVGRDGRYGEGRGGRECAVKGWGRSGGVRTKHSGRRVGSSHSVGV